MGRAEARGRALVGLRVPDFGEVLSDDTGEWAVGHLGGGLLEAHGLDEGGDPGDPAGGPGAHDRMWFMIPGILRWVRESTRAPLRSCALRRPAGP